MNNFRIEVGTDSHVISGSLSAVVSQIFGQMDVYLPEAVQSQEVFVFEEGVSFETLSSEDEDAPSETSRCFVWTRLPKVETVASQKERFYASHSGLYSTPLLEAAAQEFVEDLPQKILRSESRRAYVKALLERVMTIHLGGGEVGVPMSVLASLLAALALLGQGGGGDLGGPSAASQLPLLPRLSIFRHRSRSSQPYRDILRENAEMSFLLSLVVEAEQDGVLLSVSWSNMKGDHKVPLLQIGSQMSSPFSREFVLALWRALYPKNDQDVQGVTLRVNVLGDPVCVMAARQWLKRYLKL